MTAGLVRRWGAWESLARSVVLMRRGGVGLAVVLGALQLALLLEGVGVAHALSVHPYRSAPHITEVPGGSISGPLTEVRIMAVDEGRLWAAEHVAGTLNLRTDSFDDLSGAFGLQLAETPSVATVAAGHAAGEEQVYLDASLESGEGAVAVFSGSSGAQNSVWSGAGAPAKGFGGGVSGIAVDESHAAGDWAAGDVYVADPGQGAVDVFKPQAGGGEEYVAQLPGPFADPVFVAVSSSTGEVFVVDQTESGPVIDVFAVEALVGSYKELTTISEMTSVRGESLGPLGEIRGLAVNGSEEALYIAKQARVVQLTLTGLLAGEITGTPKGGFLKVESVTTDQESDALYIADFNTELNLGAIDVFGRGAVVPDVGNGPVSEEELEENRGLFKVKVRGEVDPLDAGEATCDLAWGPTEALGEAAVACAKPVENRSEFVPVEAELEGLEPDTQYFYRLQATNANGVNAGSGFGSFTTAGPGLDGSWSSEVTADSVKLNGLVKPHGHPASAYFEYGTSGAYGSRVPASGGVALGEGEGDVRVSEPVQDLVPDSTYHYRLVVEGELAGGVHETFVGADSTFHTDAAGGVPPLLDGREWELVSPPVKRGALFDSLGTSDGGAIQASVDGGSFTDLASVPTEEGAAGYDEPEQVLFKRDASGWISHDVSLPYAAPPQNEASATDEYLLFSGDLSLGLAQPRGPFTSLGSEASPEANERTPYIRHGSSCGGGAGVACYTPVVTGVEGVADVAKGVKFGGNAEENPFGEAVAVGASEDLRHVVVGVESSTALEITPTPEGGLYEWSADKPATEALELVSLLPSAPGEEAVAAGVPHLGVQAVGANVADAISADGSRVVWSTGTLSIAHLYMRDTVKGETVQLDASTTGSGEALHSNGPIYQAASVDSSTVFFLDDRELIKGQSSAEGDDLYACQMREEAGRLKCLLTDLTPEVVEGESAQVRGMVLGASQDGSYVYFVAEGVLTSQANAQGEHPVSGGKNLYVVHRGAGGFGSPQLVAVLSADDKFDWAETGEEGHHTLTIPRTARVSSNGRFLAFMSARSLTGYDNRDAAHPEHRDEEVFEYDAASGALVCASCMPDGARPVGVEDINGLGGDGYVDAHFPLGVWFAANVPGWTPQNLFDSWYQSRYLADSGRLFFNSLDALVPGDGNGAQDVYEFEPIDIGNCQEGSATYHANIGGCVDLVSSGSSDAESSFLDASENGGDVFFVTVAQLAAADKNTGYDIYDAHECTAASPCTASRVEEAVPCGSVEACRGAAGGEAVSDVGPLPSLNASGEGNVSSAGGGTRPHSAVGKHKRHHKHKKRRRHNGRRAGRGVRHGFVRGGVTRGGR